MRTLLVIVVLLAIVGCTEFDKKYVLGESEKCKGQVSAYFEEGLTTVAILYVGGNQMYVVNDPGKILSNWDGNKLKAGDKLWVEVTDQWVVRFRNGKAYDYDVCGTVITKITRRE